MAKKLYTAIGIAMGGLVVHHVHAFDSKDDLMKHLATKPLGIMWHIMETVETWCEGPSSPWDFETSRRLQDVDFGDDPVEIVHRRIRHCHEHAGGL